MVSTVGCNATRHSGDSVLEGRNGRYTKKQERASMRCDEEVMETVKLAGG